MVYFNILVSIFKNNVHQIIFLDLSFQSPYIRFSCFFFWNIPIVLQLGLTMSDMSHYPLFLSHSRRIRVSTSVYFVFCFLLKYSNSNMIRLPMSDMSHLIFSLVLFFLVSQTFPRNQIFSCNMSHYRQLWTTCPEPFIPSHSLTPSCCPLPPLSPPPLARPPPSSTIEAAHRRCTLLHLTPQPQSAATIHSCCVPSLPAPPLPLSTIEAAHLRCALSHLIPQLPSTATIHSCCAPLLPCKEQLGECVCEIKVRFTKRYFAN